MVSHKTTKLCAPCSNGMGWYSVCAITYETRGMSGEMGNGRISVLRLTPVFMIEFGDSKNLCFVLSQIFASHCFC